MEQEAQNNQTAKIQAQPRVDIATLQKRVELNREAYHYGEKAKRCGWYAVSPYYNDPVSDDFFFAGFNGVPWDKAIRGEFSCA